MRGRLIGWPLVFLHQRFGRSNVVLWARIVTLIMAIVPCIGVTLIYAYYEHNTHPLRALYALLSNIITLIAAIFGALFIRATSMETEDVYYNYRDEDGELVRVGVSHVFSGDLEACEYVGFKQFERYECDIPVPGGIWLDLDKDTVKCDVCVNTVFDAPFPYVTNILCAKDGRILCTACFGEEIDNITYTNARGASITYPLSGVKRWIYVNSLCKVCGSRHSGGGNYLRINKRDGGISTLRMAARYVRSMSLTCVARNLD